MRVLIFILILCLSVQTSYAGKHGALDDEGGGSDSSESPCKRARSPLPAPLEDFVDRLKKATVAHEAFEVEDLGFNHLQTLQLSEAEWQTAATTLQVIQWPFQSWKAAVGSHLLFEAGADVPHQNLLRNALKPLSQPGDFDTHYEQVSSNLQKIFWRHPYLKKRLTLYAWAAAAQLQHPLARLFIIMAGQNLGAESEKEWTLSDIRKEFNELLAEDRTQKFISQNHVLIKTSLRQASHQLNQFSNVPGIEEYIDLEGEDLQSREKLEQKAALGLPHYNVLLAQWYLPSGTPYSQRDDEMLQKVLGLYQTAADRGDFEGGYWFDIKIHGTIAAHRLYPQDQWGKMYKLAHKYRELSAWQGFENAYFGVDKESFKASKIPATKVAIFKDLKKILTQKRKK